MRAFIFIIYLALLSFKCFAQPTSKTIRGQINDIQNEPPAGAVIKLQKAKDSTLVQTMTVKDNGKFILGNLNNGNFILVITRVGSKPYTSNILTIDNDHPVIVLPVIILAPADQTHLKEVVVTTKKPLIEQDIDKTIVNVEAMISSATSNALEVLEKTPGITIGTDGDINLNGRSGVVVLIEGRPTYMSTTDLVAYLRSIPGSTLEKLELMSNPPAKHDAAGAAVINIRFKKNRIQGYTGSMSVSFSQGVTNSSYNSLNTNYLTKKINLFGNISINSDRNFDDDRYERMFYDSNNYKISSANLQNYYAYHLYDLTARIGMDYNLSSKTTLGCIASFYGRNKRDKTDYQNHVSKYGNNMSSSYGYGDTKGESQWRQATANINLQHKFNTTGREISADINYINYANTGKRLLDNFVDLNNGSADSNYIFQYDLPYSINIYTLKADYSHPLKNKAVLSAGMKSSVVKNDNESTYADIVNNTHQPDASKSNHFIYTENINAIYINARRDWRRFGTQAGLRVENTNTRGEQVGNTIVPRSVNTNHYTGIFTSLFVSYKLDSLGKNTLSLNGSRRINRPNYQQLNPFLAFIDQYSYSTGNPYLRPSYNINMELNYRYKQFASISFQYNRINGAYFNATQTVNTVFITRPENTDARYMMALFVNLNFSAAKWCKLNLNMAGANFTTKGTVYSQSLDRSIYAHRVNLLSQFSLPKDWNGEISWRYTSRVLNLQRIYGPRYQLNAGIQKKILKGKASLKFNVDDIFRTLRQKEYSTGLKLTDVYHINTEDTRRAGIAVNFNFGKETFARKRKYNDNAADDVKGRVD